MATPNTIKLGMIAGATVLLAGIASANARAEWRKKMAAKAQARNAQNQLQVWDANKNGFLEASEINAAKQKWGEKLDLAQLSAADGNRDGMLSLAEASNSRAFNWTSHTTKTNARGTATVNANGTAWKTEDGRAWEVDRTGTNFRGKDWQSHTTGEAQRTDTGRTWNSTTNGNTLDGNRSWETDRNGELIRNDDGTITVISDFEKTLNNGNTITGEKEKTITKTEDGRTWEAEGSRTNQDGQTTEWDSNGTATRTDDGVVRQGERTTTRPDGSSRTTEIDGTTRRSGSHTERTRNVGNGGGLTTDGSSRVAPITGGIGTASLKSAKPKATATAKKTAQPKTGASAKDRVAQAKSSAKSSKAKSTKSRSSKTSKPSRSKGGKGGKK